ncbi:hypothetical protein BSG18_23030 [Pseudomonas ogarae]|nr:hypothetical protein BSG18_23030 [Pseudomonas ogarae]
MLDIAAKHLRLLMHDALPLFEINLKQVLGASPMPWQEYGAYQKALGCKHRRQIVKRPWGIAKAMNKQDAFAWPDACGGVPFPWGVPSQLFQRLMRLKVAL